MLRPGIGCGDGACDGLLQANDWQFVGPVPPPPEEEEFMQYAIAV